MVKYPLSSRIIHWLMAMIIFLAIGLGIYMKNFLPSDATNHREIYDLHKSIGVIAIFFIIIRIANRLVFKAPKMYDSMKKYQKIIANLVHFCLYFLMVLIPFSGYLMSNSYGFQVKLFSIDLPNLVSTNYQLGQIFSEIHEISAYSILALILIHISAAAKHLFFDKSEQNIFKRMW